MDTRSRSGLTPQLIMGILAIGLGVLFTLDNLDILQADSYLQFWPTLLIAAGVAKVAQTRTSAGHVGGALFIAAGSLILLDNLRVLRFRIWDYWPLILVFIGASLVLQALGREREGPRAPGNTVTAIALLGGVGRKNNSQDFRGGELTAVMGGCEIDLRGASIQAEEAVVHVFAFWGGIEIRVPAEWTVVADGIPFMGGFDDKTRPPTEGLEQRLVIKGFAIMGGVEITN